MQYYEPNFVNEALVLLDRFGSQAKLLAGGTRIGFELREHPENTTALINLKRIRELEQIEEQTATLRIGALATAHAIASHALVRRHAPILAQAAASMGARQLRTVATIGGNICSLDPASDLVVALLAYDARCEVAGSGEPERSVPLEHKLGGASGGRQAPELVTAVTIPLRRHGGSFQKMTTRRGFEMALVSVAACTEQDAGGRHRVRLALGGVARSVIRAQAAEGALASSPVTSERARAAAHAAAKRDADPQTDERASAEYRRHLVAVLTERAILTACSFQNPLVS